MAAEVAKHCSVILCNLHDFREKWLPILNRHVTAVKDIEKELFLESADEDAELNVMALCIIEDKLTRLKRVFQDMLSEHRLIHSSISKCGKDLDKNFKTELKGLIKNEKEIESNTVYFNKTNKMIFEHLISLGRTEVAETFMKESELKLEMPPGLNIDLLRSIMSSFKSKNYIPAISWVVEHASAKKSLLFRLHREYMLHLLSEGKKLEALSHSKNLQQFSPAFDSEITGLMAVVVSYPNVERYQHMFLERNWLSLEEDLASALSDFRSPLSVLLDVGARAIPILLKYRVVLQKDDVWFGDELPMEVSVPEQVHSAFTCPILKSQTTEENPPMRLTCGHVISREALNRLSQSGRVDKLKCPYCPQESLAKDAMRIYF